MSGATFKDIFKGKEDKLEEKLEVEPGLLSKLQAQGVITERHRSEIEVRI